MKKSIILAAALAVLSLVGASRATPQPSQAATACCDGSACCNGGACCAAK